MPLFEYKGINTEGRDVKGVVDAENLSAAKNQLKTKGVFPSHLAERQLGQKEARKDFSLRALLQGVTQDDLSEMTRQLSTLVAANIPLVEALTALIDQVEKEKLKSALSQVKQQINEGSSLAKALEKFPKFFSPLYCNMVASGEASGALDIVLVRLADYIEYQTVLQKKVRSAMLYPIIMLVIGVIAVVAVFTFVIPTVQSVFEQMGKDLPLPTRILIGTSEFVMTYWPYLIGGIVAFVWGIKKYVASAGGRRQWHRVQLISPILGPIVKMLAVSRFSKTLSILLSSGIPLLSAMGVARAVVSNVILSEIIDGAREELTEGRSIAIPLRRSGYFPPLVTHMITIGEKTGDLDGMLAKVSESYEFQVSNKIETLTRFIEPILIVVMGAGVFFLVLSIMLPFFELNQAL